MLVVCSTIFGKKKLIEIEKITPRRSVYGVIIKDEKILLVNTKSSGKLWFPGGVAEESESDEQTLVREIKEEARISVNVNKKLYEIESYFYYDITRKAFLQTSVFYFSEITNLLSQTIENPDKTDEAENPQWFNLKNITEDMMQDYGFEVIKAIRSY